MQDWRDGTDQISQIVFVGPVSLLVPVVYFKALADCFSILLINATVDSSREN
jgi:hypothetical protein